MKTYACLVLLLLMSVSYLAAQKKHVDKFFKVIPGRIKSTDSEVQKYHVTLKWQNLDAISGFKMNCNIANATYIVGLGNDYVRWENVSIGHVNDFKEAPLKVTNLPSFNCFSYKAKDTAFLTEEFYKNIEVEQRDLARWLVSDAVQMQGLAWYIFDSLTYNNEFIPSLLENYDVIFENWATLTSRYQKLKWIGIGKHNDEICAIVKFESYYNPLKIENERMRVIGRSLYYGELWISLKDRQVEYSTMVEDVIMKLKSSAFPDEQLIDLQREIVFNKQK